MDEKNFQFQSKLDSIPHHVTYWAENPGHFAWIINWSLGCQVSDLWVISDKTLPLLLKKHGTFNKKLYMIIDKTEFSSRIQYFLLRNLLWNWFNFLKKKFFCFFKFSEYQWLIQIFANNKYVQKYSRLR